MISDILVKVLAGVLTTGMVTLFSISIATLRGIRAERKSTERALKCLLRSQLIHETKKYIAIGFVPADEAEHIVHDIDDMYNAYKGLKGNSTGDYFYGKFKELEIQ